MGMLDRFKKKDAAPEATTPAAERKPFGATLVEIAQAISGGDAAVLKDISACTEDPLAWFEAHQDRYEERSVDSDSDVELIQWLGLVDILEEHGWVCERDWKDELEDFSYFVQNLRGFQKLGLELDQDWLDEDEDISAWCGVLAEQWSAQGVRMAVIGIGSDSYVLFPASVGQLTALQTLAKEIGQYIQDVTEE